jgi:putative Mg2+ transporter-C (MgtC) family protein
MAELETWEVVIRLTVAALLAGAVGLEREFAGQDAGFRTHLLVAVGAALFGVVSVGAFDDFIESSASTNVRVDVTRIASYVAAGVGFIGGGAILKHRGTVRGITTATSLWTAAAIGLACGVGFWLAASVTTALVLVALTVLKPLSNWIDRRRHVPATLVVVLEPAADATSVLREIQGLTLPEVRTYRLTPDRHGTSELVVEFWDDPDDFGRERLTELLTADDRDDIRSVTLTS